MVCSLKKFFVEDRSLFFRSKANCKQQATNIIWTTKILQIIEYFNWLYMGQFNKSVQLSEQLQSELKHIYSKCANDAFRTFQFLNGIPNTKYEWKSMII